MPQYPRVSGALPDGLRLQFHIPAPAAPGLGQGILSGPSWGGDGVQGPGHTRLLLSAVQVDKEDVLICAIAGSGLLKVTDAGAAHSVSIGWVVVKDAASGPVVAAQDDEVALVVRSAAEAAVATGGEAAVLDRAGTQVTVQHPRVHQHDGHMALSQVRLDVLHTHCAVGRRGVSWCCWAPIPHPSTGSLLVPVSLLQSLGIGSSSLCPELPALSLVAQAQPRAKQETGMVCVSECAQR